jgi:hypothetical protein
VDQDQQEVQHPQQHPAGTDQLTLAGLNSHSAPTVSGLDLPGTCQPATAECADQQHGRQPHKKLPRRHASEISHPQGLPTGKRLSPAGRTLGAAIAGLALSASRSKDTSPPYMPVRRSATALPLTSAPSKSSDTASTSATRLPRLWSRLQARRSAPTEEPPPHPPCAVPHMASRDSEQCSSAQAGASFLYQLAALEPLIPASPLASAADLTPFAFATELSLPAAQPAQVSWNDATADPGDARSSGAAGGLLDPVCLSLSTCTVAQALMSSAAAGPLMPPAKPAGLSSAAAADPAVEGSVPQEAEGPAFALAAGSELPPDQPTARLVLVSPGGGVMLRPGSTPHPPAGAQRAPGPSHRRSTSLGHRLSAGKGSSKQSSAGQTCTYADGPGSPATVSVGKCWAGGGAGALCWDAS